MYLLLYVIIYFYRFLYLICIRIKFTQFQLRCWFLLIEFHLESFFFFWGDVLLNSLVSLQNFWQENILSDKAFSSGANKTIIFNDRLVSVWLTIWPGHIHVVCFIHFLWLIFWELCLSFVIIIVVVVINKIDSFLSLCKVTCLHGLKNIKESFLLHTVVDWMKTTPPSLGARSGVENWQLRGSLRLSVIELSSLLK